MKSPTYDFDIFPDLRTSADELTNYIVNGVHEIETYCDVWGMISGAKQDFRSILKKKRKKEKGADEGSQRVTKPPVRGISLFYVLKKKED